MGWSPVAATYISDFAPASSKEFLDIECGFTLKCAHDMTRAYSPVQSITMAKTSY